MKLILGLMLVAVVAQPGVLGKIETEDSVLVLTKENFEEGLKNDYVLVEFYAPWCGHCKALAPEYAKAAQKLEEEGANVKLAKVNAIQEVTLAEKHEVHGYPTIKFFIKGTPIEYTGGRKAEEIVAWLKKKTGPPAKDLPTVEEAKKHIESSLADLGDRNGVLVVGFFKDVESDAAKVFLEVATVNDDHEFAISSNEDVFKEYEVQDGQVVLFKNFDEKKNVFTEELEASKLRHFISTYSLPLVVDFNHETAKKIFSGDINNHFLLFLNKQAKHYEKYVDEAKAAAEKFRGQLLFVTIDTAEADHERILEFFAMDKEEVPAMRIIKMQKEIIKYKPEQPELTSENILNFATAFSEGKLKKHLLNQDLPEDWDKHPVKVLVASNFYEVAHDPKKKVLVEFYAPWCGHCKQLAPIYEALGEKYKDSEDVVIAKMDATANELEDVPVTGYPTITLYKKGTNEAVKYLGTRTLEGLSQFVDTDGAQQEHEEAQEEEEDDDVPRKDEL